MISTVTHGITMWVHHQTEEELRVHAPMVGSLRGPDVLLTAAFTEQFQSIGWYHFLLGHLSSYWGKAAAVYAKTKDPYYPKVWMAQVTSIVWKYSRSLWSYRNSIVHGATDEEVTAKIRGALDDRAKSLYNSFWTSPHFILTCHHYLFTCRNAYDLTMIASPFGFVQLKKHNKLSSIITPNRDSKPQEFLRHFMKLVRIASVTIHLRQTLSIIPKYSTTPSQILHL